MKHSAGSSQPANTPGAATGTYQTSFANRDMKVNKMYAKFQQKFGNANGEAGDAPHLGIAQDGSNFREGNSSDMRRDEGEKDSRSPEMDGSTGMQRSSAKPTPQAPNERIQQRMQNLSRQLNTATALVTSQAAEESKASVMMSSAFQGSFQRTPQAPSPHMQPERPILSDRLQKELEKRESASAKSPAVSNSNSEAGAGGPLPQQNLLSTQSIDGLQQPSETPNSSNSSHSRLRLKLADYMSPTAAATNLKQGVNFIQAAKGGLAVEREPSFNDVSKIKRRKHARKLFGAIEQAWVPSLKRIKADAFDTLKHKTTRTEATNAMEAEAYASVQSFGMTRNKQQIDAYVLDRALSGETANFEGDIAAITRQRQQSTSDKSNRQESPAASGAEDGNSGGSSNRKHLNKPQQQRQVQKSTLSSGLKSQFLTQPSQNNQNWRSTTPKAVNQDEKKSVSPKESNQFNFRQLEEVSNTKYELLAKLSLKPLELSDDKKEVGKSQSKDPTIESEFQAETGILDDKEKQEELTIVQQALTQQSQSIASSSEVILPLAKAKPSMLSPIRSSDAGYQYPKADTKGAIYSTKFDKNSSASVRPVSINAEQMYSSNSLHADMMEDHHAVSSALEYHHELGEAPVSARPTDLTDSQFMFSTGDNNMKNQLIQSAATSTNQHQSSQKNYNFQRDDDQKTTKILDVSPPPAFNNQKVAKDVLNAAAALDTEQNQEDKESLKPMKLEFLNKNSSNNAQDEMSQSVGAVATLGLETVQATLTGRQVEVSSMLTSVNTSMSKNANKIDHIQPIMSLFSGEMLAKANKVNQEVSDRIAKIKAMKEEILRPRESKSKSSVRSGRQMSDQDYNQITKELSMNIELKKVTGSEAGSEMDALSDRGDVFSSHQLKENPATQEYFLTQHNENAVQVQQKRRRQEEKRSMKKSFDFRSSGGSQSFTATEIQSPPLRMSNAGLKSTTELDSAEQQSSPIATPSQLKDSTAQKQQEFEEFKPERNLELMRLKMQNGFLIMSKRVSQQATVAKQVFLARWKNKVFTQKHIMTRFINLTQNKVQTHEQLMTKKALHTWKAFKDEQLQDEMNQEITAVIEIQKTMLHKIQKSFTDRRNQRTLIRYFNAYLELYNQRKEIQQSKTQACSRLVRVLRRQIHKRMRNSWKAMNQLPFVSDLADEDVFSLGSAVPSRTTYSVRNSQISPINYNNRSVSANDRSSMKDSPMNQKGYRMTTLRQQTTPQHAQERPPQHFEPEIKLDQIKAGCLLFRISEKRFHRQSDKPNVEGSFRHWKVRVRFMSKDIHRGTAVCATQASPIASAAMNDLQIKKLRSNESDIMTRVKTVHSNSAAHTSNRQSEQAFYMQKAESSNALLQMPQAIKQASFTNKPNRQLEEVYEQAQTTSPPAMLSTKMQHLTHHRDSQQNNIAAAASQLDHEMRADMLNMLNDPQPASHTTTPHTNNELEPTVSFQQPYQDAHQPQQRASMQSHLATPASRDPVHQPSIVTTSDISSVELDSDDSCFAATVEVIKLAPVKKNKVQQQQQQQQQVMTTSASQPVYERMPSTTNVSQVDSPQQQLKQKSTGALHRVDFQRIQDADDGGRNGGDQPQSHHLRMQMEDHIGVESSDPQIDDDNNVSRTPPVDDYSQDRIKQQKLGVKSNQQTTATEAPQQKRQLKLVRPKFNNAALLSERQSLPAQKFTSQKVSYYQKKEMMTSPKAKEYSRRSDKNSSKPRQPSSHGAHQTHTAVSFFGKKSGSMQASSKPVSVSSDRQQKQSIDTPQFRQSLISTSQQQFQRGQNTSSVQREVDPYYEMGESPIPRIPNQQTKRKSSSTIRAEREKDNLIKKLAKVAEAQISAEIAIQEEQQRLKLRQIAKERERKTNLLFQKKNLRGAENAPNYFATPSFTNQSQVLSSMQSNKITKQNSRARIPRAQVKYSSITRNQSKEKSASFVSANHPAQAQNRVSKPMVQQAWTYQSTPNRNAGSKSARPRNSSTTFGSPIKHSAKQALSKINVQACLINPLKVRMPHGVLQKSVPVMPTVATAQSNMVTTSGRHSDQTLGSATQQHHNLYGQNPFLSQQHQSKMMVTSPHLFTGINKPKKPRAQSNLKKTPSRTSLLSISDRPLKNTYVPPVYKSRAFRSRRNESQSRQNSDLGNRKGNVALTTGELSNLGGLTADTGLMNNFMSGAGLQTSTKIQIDYGEGVEAGAGLRILDPASSDGQSSQRSQEFAQPITPQGVAAAEEEENFEEERQSPSQTNIVVTQSHLENSNPRNQDRAPILVESIDEDTPDRNLAAQNSEEQESSNVYMTKPKGVKQFTAQINQESSESRPGNDSEQRYDPATPDWINAQLNKHSLVNSSSHELSKQYSSNQPHTRGQSNLIGQDNNNEEYQELNIDTEEEQKRTLQSVQSQQEITRDRGVTELIANSHMEYCDQVDSQPCHDKFKSPSEQEEKSNNFTLGIQSSSQRSNKEEAQVYLGMDQALLINQDRRLTFGRQTDQNSVSQAANDESPQLHIMLDDNILESVSVGLERLGRALQPRLERYKVELFINLCEILDEDDENQEYGEEFEQIPASGQEQVDMQVEMSSEDEDVYGSSKYLRPRALGKDNQYGQY